LIGLLTVIQYKLAVKAKAKLVHNENEKGQKMRCNANHVGFNSKQIICSCVI